MKSILLIGLGRFGRHIAEELNKLGHEVMAVDENEDRVNAVLSIVTNAQIGDSTNAEFLEALGVRNFDVCIVAISGNFQSSLETTSLLKELGAKMVVSRAERDVQAKLYRAGPRPRHSGSICAVRVDRKDRWRHQYPQEIQHQHSGHQAQRDCRRQH